MEQAASLQHLKLMWAHDRHQYQVKVTEQRGR